MCPNPNGFPWNFSPRARERTSFQTAPGVPIMAYTGELLPKGVPFSDFRYMKRGRDFTRSSIWKGTEICHLDLWKGILRGRRKKGRGRGEGGGRNQSAEQMNFMASYSRENILFLWLSPI